MDELREEDNTFRHLSCLYKMVSNTSSRKRFWSQLKMIPSSKRCSTCGQINNDLQLSDRLWTYQCGETHQRDVNASIDLKEEGMQILQNQGFLIISHNSTTVGTTGSHAAGDCVRPAFAGSGQGRRNPSAFRQW